MKNRENSFVQRSLLCLASAALLLAGSALCAEAETDVITVTDMTGREIVLDQPASRVIALSAADCENLYAIGAGDLLVGRGEYCNYPEEVLELPAVQSGENMNLEEILALEPDVLLMSTMGQTKEQVQALEDNGVKVVVSDAADIEGVYASLAVLGQLTGHEEEAAAVEDGMKAVFEELREKAEAAGETKTVYFEVSPLEYGLWTAGEGTFMNEIAEMVGLKNVFADVTGWAEVSQEQVLEANPDIIVTIAMYFGEGPTPEEEIAGREGWDQVTAVQNGAILNLQNDELSRPAVRLADGARMLFDFAWGAENEEETEDAAEAA